MDFWLRDLIRARLYSRRIKREDILIRKLHEPLTTRGTHAMNKCDL